MVFTTTPQSKKTIKALWRLEKIILDSLDFNEVVQEICDSILLELGYLKLGYEIVVLCLLDEKGKYLQRISISQTQKAHEALAESSKPFHDILIPLSYKKNILVQAMERKSPRSTTSWTDVLQPALSEAEIIRIQKDVGIKASLVYPVISRNEAIGTLILSMSKPMSKITPDERDLIGSFSDIVGLAVQNASLYTQIDQANLKLKKANRELRHLDKLKDEFVFIATHELKNPVTAMRGYLYMIEKGMYGKLSKKLKEAFAQLNSSNRQLVELVNDLLQIARAEARTIKIKTQPVNLCSMSNDIITNLRPLAEQKHLNLVHRCQKEVSVSADPDRLKEILNNLISNAIKYSDKGQISISHNQDEKRDNFIVTQVVDQGVGILKKDQSRIFSRFFRSDDERAKGVPGTGLGLFIVKQLVEKMGGKILFSSKQGEGSTFSFTLPRS